MDGIKAGGAFDYAGTHVIRDWRSALARLWLAALPVDSYYRLDRLEAFQFGPLLEVLEQFLLVEGTHLLVAHHHHVVATENGCSMAPQGSK